MKGSVLTYDEATKIGKISGNDGKRYQFTKQNWSSSMDVKVGTEVDFDGSKGGEAIDVIPLTPINKSTRTKIGTIILTFFLGPFGIHRLYVGKIGTGIVMLILGLSIFGLIITGIWAFVDLVMIATDSFKDGDGNDLV